MPLTNFLDQAVLQGPLGGVAYTPPADVYFGLSTTTPTQAEGSGAPWNFTEPSAQSQLTAATGTAPKAQCHHGRLTTR